MLCYIQCHHSNDLCIKNGNGESHFNVLFILDGPHVGHRTVSTNHNFRRKRRAKAGISILPAGSCNEPERLTISNKTRPRALVQNQHTRELISAQKTPHKHNKDPILKWNPGKYKVHKLHQRYHLTTSVRIRFVFFFFLFFSFFCFLFKSCGLWTLSCEFVPHNE